MLLKTVLPFISIYFSLRAHLPRKCGPCAIDINNNEHDSRVNRLHNQNHELHVVCWLGPLCHLSHIFRGISERKVLPPPPFASTPHGEFVCVCSCLGTCAGALIVGLFAPVVPMRSYDRLRPSILTVSIVDSATMDYDGVAKLNAPGLSLG